MASSSSAYPENLTFRGKVHAVRLTATQLQIRDEGAPGGRVVYQRDRTSPGAAPRRITACTEDLWPMRLPQVVEGSRVVQVWVQEAWATAMQSTRERSRREHRTERGHQRVAELKDALRALAACALLDDDATMLAAARCYRRRMQACLDHLDPLPDLVELIH